jgi:hypothetical protein
VNTGSVALLLYSLHQDSSLSDCQRDLPRVEPPKLKKSSRQARDDLIKQFPPVPTSIPAIPNSSNLRNKSSYYNSCDWPRNTALDFDPFRKSEMRPLQPVALPNLAKELRYQRNLFPVLGSRDAVAPNDLLPENTTLGAKENTKKTRLEHEAEREAIQRSQSLDHGRVLTVDDASRDSMIRHPRQRFASDSLRPSQHLRAYMESGAHAVRNGAERRVIYQQSNAAASQHAHIHGAVAQPIAPLDTRGGSGSYQQPKTASPQYAHSRINSAESKHSCDRKATLLDTRVVADAKHSIHPTRPTLPLKLPRSKIPPSSTVNISMPLPLEPFKSTRKDPRNQVPIHPHVAFDGSIKLMAENDFPPSTRNHHKRGITRTKLNQGPRF